MHRESGKWWAVLLEKAKVRGHTFYGDGSHAELFYFRIDADLRGKKLREEGIQNRIVRVRKTVQEVE